MRFFQRLRRDESGVAMITVVGILSVVTVIAIAAFAASRQTLYDAVVVRSESQAFQLANAGIDVALANIQRNGYVSSEYPMNPENAGLDELVGGSWEVSVTPAFDSEYVATARGTASDGTVEEIEVKFFYLNIWEMNLAAGSDQSLTAGGGGVNGTSNVTGPFYVVGTIEMGGTAFIHNGPLFVKGGDIVLSGNADIGSTATPINVYCDGALRGSASSFHISNLSQSVPSIVLPSVDDTYMLDMWGRARLESSDNVMGSPDKSTTTNIEAEGGNPASYENHAFLLPFGWTRTKAPGAAQHYKYIGPEEGPSSINEGTTNLTIGGTGSWGARYGDGHYPEGYIGSHDDFAFDDVNDVLYCEGTVLVDGDITLEGDIRYVGNGTLIANGDIYVHGKVVPYTELNPAEALGLVTPGDIVISTSGSNKSIEDPPDLAGAFFAMNVIRFNNNILVKGSVVAGGIVFDHPNVHLVTNPLLPSFLPESMPGKGMSLLTRGAWARR